MPLRNSKSHSCPFDINLFDPHALKDDSSVQTALQNVASCVYSSTIYSALEIMVMSSHPQLVEFVWSASDENISTRMTECVLNTFPTSPHNFVNSLGHKLLEKLSLSLLRMTYPTRSEIPDDITKRRRDFELTLPVLQALSSLPLAESSVIDGPDEEPVGSLVKVKKSQRQKKLAKRSGRSFTVDPKPFDDLKVAMPTSPAEAESLATRLLLELKSTLEYYLSILRRPKLAPTFKALSIEIDPSNSLSTEVNEAVSEIEVPSAFPMVQPMKAALYFDSAKGFGEWRILMSTKAEKNLREAKRQDANMFKIIIKKIKELSNGHFSDDNQKRLTGPATQVPIFEAKMTRDTRLVYQIDCIPEYDSEVERQVLRVFGIFSHAQLDGRFWDSMGHQLSRKGKEYRDRCTFRNKPHHTGDNVVMPACWPGPPEEVHSENLPLLDLRKEDLEELHSLLVLEKFVTFSQALLNSILADHDVAHVFNVSPQEKQIIEHTSSCYVLGRSGTGKTTTMLFKMLGIERSWQLLSDTMVKPRQLFVTQSRVLAGKVEEYFSKLIESLASADYSPQELRRLAATKNKQHEGLIDLDDEEDWRSDLPDRFSLLEDDHFPMFITFDRLCALLEADINALSAGSAFSSSSHSAENLRSPLSPMSPVTDMDLRFGSTPEVDEKTSSNDYMQQRRASFVSYGTFLESYWNHFPQSLTKALDPSLVFSEFMGVIKGSEGTLDMPDGVLDRAAYESLSHRSQATFANQRDNIYTLFLAYMKRKKARADYDAADRTHVVIKYLRNNGLVFEKKIDFLYVDEVQDNLLIDSLLLRSICSNANGLFWAGDTAQTISVGSAFKFTDLKAFQYRVEKQNEDLNKHHVSVTAPHEFQLTTNYRSHGGIVNCAHSVVELITEFWPYSIDILAPERGIVNGLKPIFFTGWDQDTVRYEQFLFGSAGSQIEFGAQQCILVRHDAARNKLREQVGDIGLIMTLYESKGLEFNDVLLYNFFEDSTADLSQWRVVLNAVDKTVGENLTAPRFDDNKHACICSELKFLYVAITRARKNLWVVDRSENAEPMRIYWTRRDEVENCDPSLQVPHLAASSSPEEWVKTGETLFRNRRYLQAMHSFERANRPRDAAVSYAYYLREQARLTPQSTRRGNMERSKAFVTAADAFTASAANAEEGQGRQQRIWYRTAAECFVSAGEEEKAADAYIKASEYTLGARHYRKAGIFEKVVEVVQKHEEKIEHSVATQLLDVAKIHFFKQNKLDDAIKLFPSRDEALDFMEDYDLDVARATVLEKIGRYLDAAELHLMEGRTLEAIRVLIADTGNQDSMRKANECLLEGLWQNLSFSVLPSHQRNPVSSQLFKLAAGLNQNLLTTNGRNEISMFQCIASGDHSQLPRIAKEFQSEDNKIAVLLCLDHFFTNPPKIQAATSGDAVSSLAMFYHYATLLRIAALAPISSERTVKLFGFKILEDHSFFLPEGTFLHKAGLSEPCPAIRSDENGMIVSEWDLERLFKRTLLQRLRQRILAENEMCSKSQAFKPCLNFTLDGACTKPQCHNGHVPQAALTVDWYTIVVRLHFIQILILQTWDLTIDQDYQMQRSFWLGQLFETLHPALYKHGSAANLVLAKIPEADTVLPILKEWICDQLYRAEPQAGFKHYVTTIMRATVLGFKFDQHATEHCLSQAACYRFSRPYLLREGSTNVIHELIASLQGNKRYSLSAGILFLRHICERRIPVDICAVCHMMEIICGSLILARRYQNGGDMGLNDIVLPRSWLFELSSYNFDQLVQADTKLAGIFLNICPPLFDSLSFGEEHGQHFLQYEGHAISRSRVIQQIFIARICRIMCLFCYNMRSYPFKQSAMQIISKLPPPHRSAPHSSYAYAAGWEDLVRAMRNSMHGSTLDELIRLEHISIKMSSPPRWARTINYQFLDQIPVIILSGANGPQSKLRADATPFVPRQLEEPAATTAVDEADDDDINVSLNEDNSEGDDVVDVEAVSRAMESTTVVEEKFSEEHRVAATCIQRSFRVHRSRHGAKGARAIASRIFNNCLVALKDMDFPYPHYRCIFRGPLTNILVCLDGANTYAWKVKNSTKKRFRDASHQDYEDIMQMQSKYSAVLKSAISLQKILSPASELHKKRDLQQLKARVLEVEKLMMELPTSIQQEYKDDLYLAVTAIARPRQTLKKKKKPELVVELDLEI